MPSDRVLDILAAAGWHAGRRVAIAAGIPAGHPAALALEEYAGLVIEPGDSGEECAPSKIEFLDALNAADSDDALSEWQSLLQSRLCIVAELDDGHACLVIDARGRCFDKSEMHDAFCFLGDSLPAALERLVLGRRAKPMLRPSQETVTLYGEVVGHGHADLYRY